MYYTIYKTTNLINNKIYIGKHIAYKDPNDRYFGSGDALKSAIKKYGKQSFKKEILYICESIELMDFIESIIVDKEFLLREDVYNLMPGGTGSTSESARNKLKLCNTGKKHTEKSKIKMSIASSGRRHTLESIHKLTKNQPATRPISINDIEYPSISAASKEMGINRRTLAHRINHKTFYNNYRFI